MISNLKEIVSKLYGEDIKTLNNLMLKSNFLSTKPFIIKISFVAENIQKKILSDFLLHH